MSIISVGKNILGENNGLIRFSLFIYNHLPFNNKFKIKGKNNHIDINLSMLKNIKIIVKGNDNKISFGQRCTLRDCTIYISGSENNILLGDKVSVSGGSLWIENDRNSISIGSNSSLLGNAHLACIEGTKIVVGERCLFSSDVVLRTGDSHSILDFNGKRINDSKNITISDHVWFSNRCMINKGVSIGENSIIANGAIVTKSFMTPNVIIGGVPAKIVKQDINWDINRI